MTALAGVLLTTERARGAERSVGFDAHHHGARYSRTRPVREGQSAHRESKRADLELVGSKKFRSGVTGAHALDIDLLHRDH